MAAPWQIFLDYQDRRRKASLLEGRARLAAAPAEAEEVMFSLTLYPDQISLNVPATTLGRGFIDELIAMLGPPKLEPTIKCSCDWGKGVTGAMLIVLWDLPVQAAPLLRELYAFLGATLCATSVGITARVLQDIGKSREKEARIILGAAVIDDVLGLIILASVSGVILAAEEGIAPGIWPQAAIALKAGGFLAGSLLLGALLTPKIFATAARLRGPGVLVGVSLAFCFLLSFLAGKAGLAPIVGAFAAGLILEPVHFHAFGERNIHHLEDALRPLAEFLAPVFFVQMGARVDLRVFASVDTLWLAFGLTAAAIVGKQVCSLGVLGKGLNRWAVGFGMIPRGEVGLIFASIGAALVLGGERIIDATTYSAVIIMVLLTTLVTPPLLKWSLTSREPFL